MNGLVKLLRLRRSSGEWVPLPGPTHFLGSSLRACNVSPTLEAISHLVAIRRRGQQMPPGPNVLGNGSIRRQKTLGMAGRFEPLHAPLALTRRPMRVLTPIVGRTTLAMLYPWRSSRLAAP
jgi:hypothetical protein